MFELAHGRAGTKLVTEKATLFRKQLSHWLDTGQPQNTSVRVCECVVFPFSHYFSSFFFLLPHHYILNNLPLFCFFPSFFLCLFSPTLKHQTIKPYPTLTTVIKCKLQSSILKMKIPWCYSPVSARLAQSDNDYTLNRHVFDAVVME